MRNVDRIVSDINLSEICVRKLTREIYKRTGGKRELCCNLINARANRSRDLYLLKGFKAHSSRYEKWSDEADLYEGFRESGRGSLRLKIAEYPYFIFIEVAARNVRSKVSASDLRPILG